MTEWLQEILRGNKLQKYYEGLRLVHIMLQIENLRSTLERTLRYGKTESYEKKTKLPLIIPTKCTMNIHYVHRLCCTVYNQCMQLIK
jgi:hypothetical protein